MLTFCIHAFAEFQYFTVNCLSVLAKVDGVAPTNNTVILHPGISLRQRTEEFAATSKKNQKKPPESLLLTNLSRSKKDAKKY